MCDTSQCPPLGLSCFIYTAGVFTPAPQGCQGEKPLHMAPASGSALGLGVLLRRPAGAALVLIMDPAEHACRW